MTSHRRITKAPEWPKQAEARITNAYISLLRLPYGASRARLQGVLAALRDEIAFLEGRFSSDVQDEFEARVAHMDKE